MTATTTYNDCLEINSSFKDDDMNDGQAAADDVVVAAYDVNANANTNVNADRCTTDIFSTDGWQCMHTSSESKWWDYGFYNYKSYRCINGFFSLYSLNGLFCVLAVNGLYAMLSCNSFMSIVSVNSAFSIFSVNSFMSIGCMNGFMEICWGK